MTRRRIRARQGFTLVELMVSLTIGALVVAAIFTLGGASARHFQEQQRIGQLQTAVRTAMNRVRRDLTRAGMHGVPSSRAPRVFTCPTPPLPRPVDAIAFTNDDPEGNGALEAVNRGLNGVSADRLRLVGNFSTSDGYLVRGLDATGSTVFLQTSWLAFRRSFVVEPDGTPVVDQEHFQRVFSEGRMLHIETRNGAHFLVRITGSSVTPMASIAQVNISPAIGLDNPCLEGLGGGAFVAPLAEVEYAIRPAPLDSNLSPRAQEVTGANTQLVRQELDMSTGLPIPGTTRVVLDYAIDFNVNFLIDQTLTPGLPPEVVWTPGADAIAVVQNQPWQVRGVEVHLAARTPEQDPRFPWPDTWSGGRPADEPLNRFLVFTGRQGAARVRTMTTEVQMPNMVPR